MSDSGISVVKFNAIFSNVTGFGVGGSGFDTLINLNSNLDKDVNMTAKWYVDTSTQTEDSCIVAMKKDEGLLSEYNKYSNGADNHLVQSNCKCSIS